MLRSPPDVHDEHVRMLLDQRTTRADLQRVSSFSDYEDTPSVYSRAFLTPRLSDDHRDGRIPSPSPPASRSSSMPRRLERNRINELAVSMLDLDESEDNRTSFASASTYEDDMRDDSDNELDGSPMPRMSLLGPKMRVHSKAPWEVDSPLIEDDEGEMSAFSGSGNTPFHSVATGPAYPLPRVPFPSAQEQSPLLLPTTSRSPPQSYISSLHDDENSTLSRIRSNSSRPSLSSSSGEEAHPYANPNHARSSSSNSYKPPLDVTHSYSLSSADSTATETPFGRLASMSDSQADLLTPVPRSPRSIFQGKEISSPLPFHQTNPQRAHEPPEPSQLPGWMDKGSSSPNFNLISLEEARAQRSRSTTMHGSASSQPFPEREITSGHSPNNSVASRARARSISAGARAKHAITSIVGGPPVKPDRRDSEPSVAPNAVTPGMSPGKNLKHKKSGFLRLFNGRDDKSPPPPVPSLSDNFAAYSAHQGKPSKTSPHRIPVPKLDPPLAVDEPSPPATSPKRTPPPLNLSIDTSSPIPRAPSTGIGHFPSRLGGNDSIPRSAPANVTEFPSLKLRPVSTMFSAHFGDILSPSSASPPDIDTPISSTLVSPTSSMRFGDLPSIVTPSDDQSSVIRALQEQITASKKVWQRHIWELEGQIRDLKDEVEGLRRVGGEWCVACGRGEKSEELGETKSVSVVNRPRARTGTGTSRFGSAV